MEIKKIGNDIIIENMSDFDLAQTLDCGQCFRWYEDEEGCFSGVAFGKICKIKQDNDKITFYNTSLEDFNSLWCKYFDLDTDYNNIKQILSKHSVLAKASEFAPGIRVLRQDSWEALCSFIISQNNNIKRIKGIVAKLCEFYGDKICDGYYTFPSAEKLAVLEQEDLAPLKAGFRSRYIIDAAKKVASGEIDLNPLYTADIETARGELMRIVGVGIKVADCTLLYGLGRIDCFPVDVWIKRAMDNLIPEGLPDYALPYAGIAQQYIFHYVRVCPDALPEQTKQQL